MNDWSFGKKLKPLFPYNYKIISFQASSDLNPSNSTLLNPSVDLHLSVLSVDLPVLSAVPPNTARTNMAQHLHPMASPDTHTTAEASSLLLTVSTWLPSPASRIFLSRLSMSRLDTIIRRKILHCRKENVKCRSLKWCHKKTSLQLFLLVFSLFKM